MSVLTSDRRPIQVLLVEDDESYARLVDRRLTRSCGPSFEVTHVACVADALRVLADACFDAVLLDLLLPDSEGHATFFQVQERASQLPIVILTGQGDETTAIQLVREGAQDFLFKDETKTSLLVRTLCYAIERQNQDRELRRALAVAGSLTGIITVCSYCRRIREGEQWHSVEEFVRNHTAAQVSHGVCPDCLEANYEDLHKKLSPSQPGKREREEDNTTTN